MDIHVCDTDISNTQNCFISAVCQVSCQKCLCKLMTYVDADEYNLYVRYTSDIAIQ